MKSVVDDFVEEWAEKQFFWEALTRAARIVCEDGVHKRLKLKCNVYSRTKSEESIRGSLERRQKSRGTPFRTKEEIEQEMIDLSGIRIILTFPGDVDEVQKLLETEFDQVRRYFWGLDENGNAVTKKDKGRFIGYRATHFVVKWIMEDGKCRHGTIPRHVGRQIEIQVTSTAMYAWQQAHHDLIYKQLRGHPSEEERSLLEMINGLAHAGEMALAQLQTLSSRRIEEDRRRFADEYEVGIWLKTHLKSLLGLRSSIHAPFLERSALLFEILLLFGLRTPQRLRTALTWEPVKDNQLVQDVHLRRIIHQALSDEKNRASWTETFHSDSADWAIFRICVYHLKESSPPHDPSGLTGARLKAFCFANTINFALSEPSRHEFIRTVLEDGFFQHHPKSGQHGVLHTLHTLLTGRSDYAASESHRPSDWPALAHDMHIIWLNLLKCVTIMNSTFLRLSLVLSLAGIVFLPQEEHPLFLDKDAPRFVIWPFKRRPSEFDVTDSMDLGVICLSDDEPRVYELDGLKWEIARISVATIAEGRGWRPPVHDKSATDIASRAGRRHEEEEDKDYTPHYRSARVKPAAVLKKIGEDIEQELVLLQTGQQVEIPSARVDESDILRLVHTSKVLDARTENSG